MLLLCKVFESLAEFKLLPLRGKWMSCRLGSRRPGRIPGKHAHNREGDEQLQEGANGAPPFSPERAGRGSHAIKLPSKVGVNALAQSDSAPQASKILHFHIIAYTLISIYGRAQQMGAD